MKKEVLYTLFIAIFAISITSCSKERGCTNPLALNFNEAAEEDDGSCILPPEEPGEGEPTPAPLDVPQLFAQYLPAPIIPSNNPQTVEGIALGRRLFYDPLLSADGTQACADCHSPTSSFTDTNQFSVGIDGIPGNRNSMPIFNMAWNFSNQFFWDGRAMGLEGQAFGPVVNPIEMHNTWPNAVATLQATSVYPPMFLAAFGTSTIDSVLVVQAIAQFERTLISGNSKFDKFQRGEATLTPDELAGFNLFTNEFPLGADCMHCHGTGANPLWTDNTFRDNGLDLVYTDLGLGGFNGNVFDQGKFRVPSIRNLAFTAPYMHDGRFATLDEVIDHYSTGLKNSPNIDADMKNIGTGGVQLTPTEKAQLKAFLLSLSDYDFIANPAFQAPQ